LQKINYNNINYYYNINHIYNNLQLYINYIIITKL